MDKCARENKVKKIKALKDNASEFSFHRRVILAVLPRLMWMMIWLLSLLCLKRYHFEKGKQSGDQKEDFPKSFVAIFWHGEFLMLPFAYRFLRGKHHLAVVASRHFHGEIVARLYELFGFKTIRGSSNYGGVDRGGIRVLREAMNLIKEGYDIGLTPDGPKGPYHSVSDGVLALSEKTQVPLVAFRPKMSFCLRLNSWDRFEIPLPFSRIDYHISQPFWVDKNLSESERKQKIYEKMQTLC